MKNILFIFSDQQRADCLGCYGNPLVRTPHLDALAAGGVRYSNAFTPSPICTPARACVQTGMYAQQHGLLFNPEFARMNGGGMTIADDTPFFAPLLKDAGYNLAHIGKWHIGPHAGDNPNEPSRYGYEGIYYPGYGFPEKHPAYLDYLQSLGLPGYVLRDEIRGPGGMYYGATQEGPKEASVSWYLGEQTIKKIREYSKMDRPFFIGCHFWGPHQPFELPESIMNLYAGQDIPLWPNVHADLSRKPGTLGRWGRLFQIDLMPDALLSRLMGMYYAHITHLDEIVGRLIRTLEETGQLDNTLIVYGSDHGDSMGSFGMWDKGYGLYDNLVKVPLILSDPSSTRKGVQSFPVSLLDLAPTFLDAAGLAKPPAMVGNSLLSPAKPDAGDPEEPFIIEHFGHTAPAHQLMVRTSRFKYIFNAQDGDEFYDLQNDPHELSNLIGISHGKETTDYRNRLLEWVGKHGSPLAKRWVPRTMERPATGPR